MEGKDRFYFYLEAFGLLATLETTGVLKLVRLWIGVK